MNYLLRDCQWMINKGNINELSIMHLMMIKKSIIELSTMDFLSHYL